MSHCKNEPFAEMLACGICMNPFNEDANAPICLPCGHTFCYGCVQQFRATKNSDHEAESRKCPECSEEFTMNSICRNYSLIRYLTNLDVVMHRPLLEKSVVQTPPPSSPLIDIPACQICEENPVKVVCQECQTNRNLCKECFDFRHKALMQGHQSEVWKPKLATAMCIEHQQECLLFCGECTKAICTLCQYGQHKGHNASLLSEEIAACKQRIRCALADLEGATRSVQADATVVAQVFEEICGRYPVLDSKERASAFSRHKGACEDAITLINRQFGVLREAVECRRRELVDEARTMSDAKTTALAEQMDRISNYVGKNYSVCLNTKQNLDHKSDVYVLEHEEALLQGISHQLQERERVHTQPVRTRDIEFVPTAVDTLCMDLMYAGEIVTADIDPSRCELTNRDNLDGLKVNAECRLHLILRDFRGNPCPRGAREVTATVTNLCGGRGNAEGAVTVVDNCTNSCTLIVDDLQVSGRYALHVLIDGVDIGDVDIGGSPFRFTVDSTPPQLIGKGRGSGRGQMIYPSGVCSHDGFLYVSDCGNHRIQVFSCTDGRYVRSIGKGGSHGDDVPHSPVGVNVLLRKNSLSSPQGICIENRLLYVSDCGNNQIQVFACDSGIFVKSIGSGRGTLEGQLNAPKGICIYNGLLYVSDSGNNRIQAFACDSGKFVKCIGADPNRRFGLLSSPQGIATHNGLLYVSDCGNNQIQVFDCDNGQFMTCIGNGELNFPKGICTDNGLLYVSEPSSRGIQVFHCETGEFVKFILASKMLLASDGNGNRKACQVETLFIENGLLYVVESTHCFIETLRL